MLYTVWSWYNLAKYNPYYTKWKDIWFVKHETRKTFEIILFDFWNSHALNEKIKTNHKLHELCIYQKQVSLFKRIQNNSSITITIAWLLKHLILIWFHLANDQLNVLSGCDFHKTYSIFGGKFRYIQNVFSFNCMFGQFKSEKQKNRTEFNPINLIYLI